MRHARAVVVVLLACAAAAPAAGGAPAAPAPAAGEAAEARCERQMIDELNRVRARHDGLRPLRAAPRLGRRAARVSGWLMRNHLFAHSPQSTRRGSSRHTGEALEMHFSRRPEVRGTVRRWLASPAHRALVLTDSMNTAGVGRATGRFRRRPATVWVLELARR